MTATLSKFFKELPAEEYLNGLGMGSLGFRYESRFPFFLTLSLHFNIHTCGGREHGSGEETDQQGVRFIAYTFWTINILKC